MRVAHAILVHRSPEQVKRLVQRIGHKDVDIWIHVDKKSDGSLFRKSIGDANVFFVKRNVDVAWAGFSMVEAMLSCIREILANQPGKYDYINFLSGQDYPIKDQQKFLEFLADKKGWEFVGIRQLESEGPDWERFTGYYFNELSPLAKRVTEKLARTFLSPRRFPYPYSVMRGTQWITVSAAAAAYIIDFVDKNRGFCNYFRRVHAPDEFFFQTILYNSPFRYLLMDHTFHYTDWSEGKEHPRMLTLEDAGKLVDSENFFARKFDMVKDPGILDFLDKYN